MRDALKMYWMAFNTALQAKFEYRIDFFLGVLTSFMLQMSSFAFIYIVFNTTPGLNGWTKDEVILLFGMTAAALGSSELFFNHIWMVPYYIVTGDLDRLLTYPVNSLYFLLITRPELHSFGNLATGLALSCYELVNLHAPWYSWILMPFLVLCGCLIYTAALVVAGSLSFKFIGPTSMHLMIPHTLLQSTRYPLSIYPTLVQYLLLVLIPYGTFSYLPASFLFDKSSEAWLAAAAPFASLLFLWEAQKIWRWGIDKYESTGS